MTKNTSVTSSQSAVPPIEWKKPGEPARFTGIRLKYRNGDIKLLFNDGSIRNAVQRAPELSERQFRKMLKLLRRKHKKSHADASK